MTTHQVSFVGAQSDMWWQIEIETKTMPTKPSVNSKHKLSWNTTSFYGLNILWFHVELLQANDTTF
jgi:hypothetical protein